MDKSGDRDKRDKNSQVAPRRKAEPRPSLAPLRFEDALESLLAVKPPPVLAETPDDEPDRGM